ncbi:MAG: MarR family transcriptional regulator [Phycisphaerales bacterium]|nr:MarR family transcriptional regulator [Phycisphaerales bacterium]
MSSGNLNQTQRCVLEHLARYRLSFQEIVSALYFEGASPQKTLNQLREQGLIETQKGFGGNRTAYVLTRAGAGALGASRRRADNLGSEALPANLAVLAFCLLRGRARIRLNDNELVELLGEPAPAGRFHCLERGARATRIYHVYAPGDSTRVADVVARTRSHVAEVRKLPTLEPWLRHEFYSHAILVDNEDRAAELNAAIDDANGDGKPLRSLSHIHVETVPGLASFEEALRELAQENQAA